MKKTFEALTRKYSGHAKADGNRNLSTLSAIGISRLLAGDRPRSILRLSRYLLERVARFSKIQRGRKQRRAANAAVRLGSSSHGMDMNGALDLFNISGAIILSAHLLMHISIALAS